MQSRQQDQRYEQFIRYFVAHRHQIYLFIFAQVANKPDAEDIFQEVSTVLWRKFDTFEPGTNFLAWARQVARHLVLNYRRRQARSMAVPLDPDIIEALARRYEQVQDELEDRLEALRHCVTRLAPPNRELVQRLYQENEPTRSVAASFGVTVQRIYQRLGGIHEVLMRCIRRTLTVSGERS